MVHNTKGDDASSGDAACAVNVHRDEWASSACYRRVTGVDYMRLVQSTQAAAVASTLRGLKRSFIIFPLIKMDQHNKQQAAGAGDAVCDVQPHTTVAPPALAHMTAGRARKVACV